MKKIIIPVILLMLYMTSCNLIAVEIDIDIVNPGDVSTLSTDEYSCVLNGSTPFHNQTDLITYIDGLDLDCIFLPMISCFRYYKFKINNHITSIPYPGSESAHYGENRLKNYGTYFTDNPIPAGECDIYITVRKKCCSTSGQGTS